MSYIISNPHSRTIWSSKVFRIHPFIAEKSTRFLFKGTFGHTVHLHTTRWVPFDKERRCLAFVMREIRMHANEPLFTLLNFRINMSQHNRMLPSDANDFKQDCEGIFYLISALHYNAIAVRHMRSYDVRSLSRWNNMHHCLTTLSEATKLPQVWQHLHFQLCAS